MGRGKQSGEEELHAAARSGDLNAVQSSLISNPLLVNSRDKHSRTPFFSLAVRPVTVKLIIAAVHVSFFLGISSMAERVTSLKTGGAYWFLDLSTPDSLYIFPNLTALSIWYPSKVTEMASAGGIAKVKPRCMIILAALSFPLTMGLPKAVLLYWIAHTIFHRPVKLLEHRLLRKIGPKCK